MQDIGKLDKRVEIYSYGHTVAADNYGQPTHNYALLHNAWAFMREISGSEKNIENKDVGVFRVEFTIRHIPNLNTKMQIRYNSRRFDIHHIKRSEYSRDDYITLLCEEVI